jgi:hypothetical protein
MDLSQDIAIPLPLAANLTKGLRKVASMKEIVVSG